MRKKIIVLSANAENLCPQLGLPPSDIEQGNYKDVPTLIAKIKSGAVRGVIIDGTLPSLDFLAVVVGLRQAGIVHSESLPIISLGGTTATEKVKSVATIAELTHTFPQAA